MKVVSFPMYVNVTHLCVGVCVMVDISLCGSLVGFGLGGLCGWIGKVLLYKMLWIMFFVFMWVFFIWMPSSSAGSCEL